MTGYAWKEKTSPDISVSAEIKSYNSRFLELSVNIPHWLGRLENKVREYASSRIQRGKVDISIRIKEKNANLQITADLGAAKAYVNAISEIAHSLNRPEDIPLSLVIEQEGVMKAERVMDADAYWEHIQEVLAPCFTDFESFRLSEGKALYVDILNMVGRIEKDLSQITARIPEMESFFKDTIKNRFLEVLGNQVDEQRILQETAALMVKYTINEEVVRLRAHLDSLRHELETNPSPGRKADFICQEINREINTIGSKNQILEIGQCVIDAKDALENIREQMRNIE